MASYSRRVSLPVPATAVTDEEDKESEESDPQAETVEGGSVAQVVH